MPIAPTHERWMRAAIEQADKGIASGQTPFGAVVVRGETLVAAGHNEVWQRTDPTAHAEVVTIQRAAAALHSIDLRGCVMYTTTEPCPMCAAAIHWCKLDSVYFGASIADARNAGFSELTLPIDDLYKAGLSPVRVFPGLLAANCTDLFRRWKASPSHRAY